jgi:hypothetical protein
LLSERYSGLSPLQKDKLASGFRNAPLMLRLLDFLEKQKQQSFQTHTPIQFVYGITVDSPEYRVTENKFFKLRKKLLDALSENTEAPVHQKIDEELELRQCIELLNKGQRQLAYKRLEELEKNCWEKNIFELLPRVIDRLVFCNQSFNKLDENKAIYKRYDEAVALNTLILQFLKKVRQVYEINFRSGITAAKSELRFLKKTADRYKKYPRFAFIYHHLSLYYKLASNDYIGKMPVIGKHHAALKAILRQNGSLPIFYTPDYEYTQGVHLREISIFYQYVKCDFKEAYKESCELNKYISDNNSPKAESFYYNSFRAALAAGYYPEARKTLEEYLEVLRKNNQHDRMPFVHALLMMLYVYAYPKVKLENLPYTEQLFEQYLKWSKKNKYLVTSYEESLIVKAGYNHIRGLCGENLALAKTPGLESYFETKDLYQLFLAFTTYFAKEPSRKQADELKNRIDAMKFKILTPNSVLLLKRMREFLA